METKIFLERGIVDISHIKISIQENNSKVSDQQYSKYMFPVGLKMTPELIRILGDYVSYESNGLENKIPCLLLFENKIHDAFLYIQSSEGYDLTLQVDFGFEELPNSEKKLSELPFEKFEVADIHSYAKSICEKSWPQTNFNFPRIYTTQYPVTDEVWKDFDGYLNDLKKDGTEMRRNYIEEDGVIRNVNIIHPCPHPIYVLKTGFQDAGFELQGDILTDTALQNRWIYSGTDYFTSKRQRKYGFNFNSYQYDEVFEQSGPDDYCWYDKRVTIEKTGRYKLAGILTFWKARKMNAEYRLYLNGNIIWQRNQYGGNNTILEDIPLNFEFDVAGENSELKLTVWIQYHPEWSHPIANLLLTSKALEDIASNEEESNVITNPNEIDLSRAVPDMTFPEYVNVFRNWFNYDVEISGKIATMNKIGNSEISDVKDFSEFESPFPPLRNFLNKKSFLLRFPELDEGFKKDSMFYDSSGQKINGKENSESTIIDIRGYAMELILPKPQGYKTANVMKKGTDLVALVQYSGLLNGQNNATYSGDLDFPELFTRDWVKWLRQRIHGQEFVWRKKVNIERFSKYRIKNYIFCYNNIHIIKSLTKDKVSDNHYEIEFTTETVV